MFSGPMGNDRPIRLGLYRGKRLKVPESDEAVPEREKSLIIRPLIAFIVTALLAVSATSADAQGDPAAQGVLALREFDGRVATIGHRLAVASLDLCEDRQWRPGIALHDLSQYGGDSRAAGGGTAAGDTEPVPFDPFAGGYPVPPLPGQVASDAPLATVGVATGAATDISGSHGRDTSTGGPDA